MKFIRSVLRRTFIRVSLGICAVILAVAASLGPGASTAESADRWLCCPDEWQGGGICPWWERVASYCDDSACQSCGTMFCYSGIAISNLPGTFPSPF